MKFLGRGSSFTLLHPTAENAGIPVIIPDSRASLSSNPPCGDRVKRMGLERLGELEKMTETKSMELAGR